MYFRHIPSDSSHILFTIPERNEEKEIRERGTEKGDEEEKKRKEKERVRAEGEISYVKRKAN